MVLGNQLIKIEKTLLYNLKKETSIPAEVQIFLPPNNPHDKQRNQTPRLLPSTPHMNSTLELQNSTLSTISTQRSRAEHKNQKKKLKIGLIQNKPHC